MFDYHMIQAIVKYKDNSSLVINHVFSINFDYFGDIVRIYYIANGQRTRCIISNSCIIGIYFKSVKLR